ncbi:MAG TPA: pyridoxal-dependent decarboxylase [Spirochaetota bacterium]|nr:pyridoxal-dependent decarboxylase [Spirochaetota bacterium]HPC40385.1 pyridoxal-dependent decarboxylase [Spirochaetota bacterium]HPL17333.1 pyridoxal-dependent decarboxylase [Spirochaetota bacterium]HQF07684.1 pyridoxal-dependent decarboxylase [Spirochaetota bacterium]HQH96416.1 pyridoxal-dependent decarboxylase [Spirochaetota bacterium]
MADQHEFKDPFKPYKGRFQSYERLPARGRDKDDILKELETMSEEENAKWKNGRVSGTYYHAGDDHREFQNRVFSLYSHVNVLQVDLCPSMSKFESEIISMTARMLNGDAVRANNPDDEICGSVTFGGSESIMMAMKVYRDRGRAEYNITEPEIILPITAHPAFHKAGEYFGIKMVLAPVDESDFRVIPEEVEKLINKNTVAIVASAGNYPYGLIDPMDRLSDIALKHDIGFHIDGCLGGFILPWVERLGYRVPVFDFRLPGLTSMSADTHKFGYGHKGNSVVLYRNLKLRRYQFFQMAHWPGGIYASPSMTGSRSGGLTASTWATMVYLGESGYLEAAAAIMKVADRIKEGVKGIKELEIIGDPTFLISIRSRDVDIFHVNDHMISKGWRFNGLQNPAAIHFCVTMPQTFVPGIADALIDDLKAGVEYAKTKKGTPARSSALYGLSGSLEGRTQLVQVLYGTFEHLFRV